MTDHETAALETAIERTALSKFLSAAMKTTP